MEEVAISKIIESKILKFDLFDLNGNKIFSMGEILTPGKIMKIKDYSAIFKKIEAKRVEDTYTSVANFIGPNTINKFCIFLPKEQKDLIKRYIELEKLIGAKNWKEAILSANTLRDNIVKLISQYFTEIKYAHQLKLIGKYENVHALNVSLYATMLAKKLELDDNDMSNIALASILHDIGKVQIPKEALDNPKESKKNYLMYQSHTVLGFRTIKNDLGYQTSVARPALEHHEKMDGSGWPYGVSNTSISLYSQHINVANVFDNLSTAYSIEQNPIFNNVLKELLKLGSKVFLPKSLYTFVNMFSYSDNTSYWDLINDSN